MVLLSLVVITPLAFADHAYSHRYIIFGRVVDAENNPVPGLQLEPGYSAVFKPEGACGNQPGTGTDAWTATATNPITNQYGEFFFCHHIHAMSRSEPGTATFLVEGKEYKMGLDGFMRYSFVEIKLDNVHASANKEINAKEHTIQGRAWASTGASEKQVEGIRVFGDTLYKMPANITFSYNGKEPIKLNTTTNNYGDFALRVPVTERPTTGTVSVEIGGNWFNETVSPTGSTHVRGQVGKLATSNIPAPTALLAIAVVAFAAIALRRRGAP